MTAFKKLTAYNYAKRKWVSTICPYDEENARLKAENAELCERLELANSEWEKDYFAWLEALDENERLRTLVDVLMKCGTKYHTMRGACPLFDPDAPDFCKASQMARELGIEVPE